MHVLIGTGFLSTLSTDSVTWTRGQDGQDACYDCVTIRPPLFERG